MVESLSPRQIKSFDKTLESLRGVLPFTYAQWVEESRLTSDYAVVASRSPQAAAGYDIAHRPGVIGQVFRRGRPIFIPHVNTHVLYDLFDPGIEWELTLPLNDGTLAAVLNFEGSGTLDLDKSLWKDLGALLFSQTGLELAGAMPEPGEAWMVKTNLVEISGERPQSVNVALRLGRAAATGGLNVLVAGALDLSHNPAYPSVDESLAAGVPLGGCFRGGGSRLDLLEVAAHTGSDEDSAWWSLADGRYDFVLRAS